MTSLNIQSNTPNSIIHADIHHNIDSANQRNADQSKITISSVVEQNVRNYFMLLDGEEATGLYQLMIDEMEKPLLKVVLEHTRGNQSKTAEILGLNRGTLRKKMALHGLL